MKNTKNPDSKSAFEAKFDAQRIAFAPVVFQVTKSLRDLGILQMISDSGDEGVAAESIAEKLNLSLYGIKTLLELGISIELVYVKQKRYVLTKTGFFILHDPMTIVNLDFIHDVCYRGLFHLTDAVIKEKPSGLKEFGEWPTIYEALSSLPTRVQKSWFAFDHYYSDLAFPEALPLVFKQQPRRLFDVGGNTGKWAIACARYDPDVSVTILDLPGQLEKAYENIRENGLENRIDGFEIDLLDRSRSFPSGADAIWMSQFLDCFSESEIVHILKTAGTAMTPDTDLFILEPFWNRQQFEASTFSLQATSIYFTCMANGNSKMYHSDEMYHCLGEAGFKVVEDTDNIGICHTLLRCRINNR
jgi:hypothetical protein